MVVDPVQFLIGPVSRGAAGGLAGLCGGYALLTGLYAVRGVRHRLEDRWSAVFAFLVMAALAVLLWRDGARILPAPFSVGVLAVALGGIVFTLTYTLGRYHEKVARFQTQFGARLESLLSGMLPEERYEEWRRLRSSWSLTPEERRKTPHLMMGIFLVFYAAVGHLILRGAWTLLYGGGAVLANLDAEGIRNLSLASHAPWLAGGQMFALFCLLGFLLLIVPTELLRLKFPELSYPFKSVILSRLRRREKGLFGAHYYIVATTTLVVFWLTRDPTRWDTTIPAVAAVLGVSIFADSASALVGIRWGRRKWVHNPNKSLLGSAGGTTVAFLVALPFVGLPMAVASAATFLVVDLVAPVPISVSDNLLNPLALTACYGLLMGHLQPWIPYY